MSQSQSVSSVRDWSERDVVEWLKKEELGHNDVEKFKGFDGKKLMTLTEEALLAMGIRKNDRRGRECRSSRVVVQSVQNVEIDPFNELRALLNRFIVVKTGIVNTYVLILNLHWHICGMSLV